MWKRVLKSIQIENTVQKGVRGLFGNIQKIFGYSHEKREILIPNRAKNWTSTVEQHLDRGLEEIKRFCEENDYNLVEIFTDQKTGRNFERPSYQLLRNKVLRAGDILIITELDRLGRDKKAILDELRWFKEHDIRVMILELPTTLIQIQKMDNSIAEMLLEAVGNMLIELYASMAQAEMEKKDKRQREGIMAKKERGEWDDYGRPRKMSLEEFSKKYEKVESGEKRPFQLMRELGMTKATFYRYKKEVERKKEQG